MKSIYIKSQDILVNKKLTLFLNDKFLFNPSVGLHRKLKFTEKALAKAGAFLYEKY